MLGWTDITTFKQGYGTNMIFLTDADGCGRGYLGGYTDGMLSNDDRYRFSWGYGCGDGDHYGDFNGAGECDHRVDDGRNIFGDGDNLFHVEVPA